MKLVPTALLTEIQANVATLATCIEIRRADGKTYRLTNHDTALTIDGNVYEHTIPFNLAAISSGSNFASDNTELTLFIDGTTFIANDFNNGVFTSAGITIMLVNFLDPTDGKMIFREGWFGPIDTNTYGIAKVTIYGMLKVLDIEIGRVYQPSCDADLGDSRCKIAIKGNQIYNTRDLYRVGDWVHHFDPALGTEITLTNPSFEVDAPVAENDPIPGWTKGGGSERLVVTGTVGPLSSFEGSFFLYGGETESGEATERTIYQEIDLEDEGVNTAEIDDGQISVAYFANLAQAVYLLDPIRLRLEVLDADFNIIDAYDDGYKTFSDFDYWFERTHAGPLLEGARHLRLQIFFLFHDGVVFNAAADNVRLYWWNHISGSPTSDIIHKVARLSDFDVKSERYAENGSFEVASMANSNTIAITGWTRGSSADWWRVVGNAYLGIIPTDGSRALIGGDDSSGIQKTYVISQTKDLADFFNVDEDSIDLGLMIGKLRMAVIYYDMVSSARVVIDLLEEDGTTLTSTIVALDYTPAGSTGAVNYDFNFAVPFDTRKVRITLSARSDVGASNADVGFDNIRWYFVEAERPRKDDPLTALGTGVTFETSAGSYTVDDKIIWKAHTAHMGYDVVDTVTDLKTFTGTSIAGGASEYVTAMIRWISGSNKGQRNLIRLWNGDTKAIKLYFPSTNPIVIGDRFQYIRPCHKRFLEDCSATFDNVLNFRGFPHLPGKLT